MLELLQSMQSSEILASSWRWLLLSIEDYRKEGRKGMYTPLAANQAEWVEWHLSVGTIH